MNKLINNFITQKECDQVTNDISNLSLDVIKGYKNSHVKYMLSKLHGFTSLTDITRTKLSTTLAKLQGEPNIIDMPGNIFYSLSNRISNDLNISNENTILRIINMESGGSVYPHYGPGLEGYISYNCNIQIYGPENDIITCDCKDFIVNKCDLYCFESNLYKYNIGVSDTARIILSYIFILPYEELGWSKTHPRIRMSNRIMRKFIY